MDGSNSSSGCSPAGDRGDGLGLVDVAIDTYVRTSARRPSVDKDVGSLVWTTKVKETFVWDVSPASDRPVVVLEHLPRLLIVADLLQTFPLQVSLFELLQEAAVSASLPLQERASILLLDKHWNENFLFYMLGDVLSPSPPSKQKQNVRFIEEQSQIL